MKKLFMLLVASVLSISLIACGSDKGTEGDTNDTTNEGSVEDSSSKVKVIDIQLTQEEYAFGVDNNNPELLEAVNEFIAEIQEDGTFDDVLNNYFGDSEPVGIDGGELDESKEQLVVATNAAFEPFEFMKGDKFTGIDMELAQMLADKLELELVISNMDFDAVVLSVGQGKADIGMAGLTITEDRKELVNFSAPYYNASQKVVVLESDTRFDDCETIEDVEAILNELDDSTVIGVQKGTTGNFYVEGNADYEGFDVETKVFTSGSLAIQDMINGNVDIVVIDEAPAEAIVGAMNALN